MKGTEPGKTAPKGEPLTLKQELFVQAYLGKAKGNATLAAKLAGYTGNAVTLAAVAYDNLRKPQIRRAVDARLESQIPSPTLVMREIALVAMSPAQYDENGHLRNPASAAQKLRALELLGKYHALFVDVTKGIEVPKDEKELDEFLIREWKRVKGEAKLEPVH